MPPSRGRLNASRPLCECASSMSSRWKPSATTTSGARPRSRTDSTHSQIWSIDCGCSGMRIACAPPAMPECRAIQPTWRPMTSTHDAAAVRLGGGAQPVDRLGRDLDGGVEAERVVGGREVVVDGLRHADDLEAGVGEAAGRGERALAADRDDRVDAVRVEHPLDVLGAAALALERVGAARAEDRAALLGEAAHVVTRDRHEVALDDAPPAPAEADELRVVRDDALQHRRRG